MLGGNERGVLQNGVFSNCEFGVYGVVSKGNFIFWRIQQNADHKAYFDML